MKTTQNKWEQAIHKLGIVSLTEMQIKTLEVSVNFSDLLILSPTGTGKTLAFLLPVLESLQSDIKDVQVLIITPSRELAQQIESVFRNMGTDFKINSCYGGHSKTIEKNNFILPPAVLAGTPGRLADHLRSGNFSVKSISTLILDEFDKSLEYGFQEEMSFIISNLTSVKRRILSSATDLSEIPAFTGIKSPYKLNYLLQEEHSNRLTVNIVKSKNKDKLDSLFQLLCCIPSASTLIFCNHRDAVERISNHLNQSGIINNYFHGGLEQSERERMIVRFRNGSSNILITTDLASRGLDIPDISYIIHYQLPANETAFIHRNGRTARMNSKGSSFLIFSEGESIPDYIKAEHHDFVITEKMFLPAKPLWQTLYIGGGKKDKINKMDIVGFLSKQGGLGRDELGHIDIKDHHSYAAVRSELIYSVLTKVKNTKIKNKKVKIEISY
jgi:ATP-independent RNA helicase DbpA